MSSGIQPSAEWDDRRGTSIALTVVLLLSISAAVLLPVVPAIVEQRGRPGEAGAATAALLIPTVLGEILASWLMGRVPSKILAFAALLLAGVPALGYLILHLDVAPILLLTALRGMGMGIAAVICVAVISQPPIQRRRGTTFGLFGLATTGPIVVFPSIGLFLVGLGHLEFAVALSIASALLGALVGLGFPRAYQPPLTFGRSLAFAFFRGEMIAMLASLIIVNMSFGAVISFIPVTLPTQGLASSTAFLLVYGVARTGGRVLSGVLIDRHAPRDVVVIGIAATAAGLALLPLNPAASLLYTAAAIYGVGSGAVQTGTYLIMVHNSTGAEVRLVSAAWNIAIDFGTAVGAAVAGVVAASYGYGAVFWLLPVMVAAAVPLALARPRD